MTTTSNESDNAPVEVSSVADFTQWVNQFHGENILFRGMANTKWDVESSLHRRLKHNNLEDVAHDIYHNVFVEMVKILINRTRRNRHDIENNRQLKDLDLLAKLQHYGAATCLIDFTKNSLVALYFACASVNNKNDNNANGKVVAFDSDNAKYDEISINDFDKKIEYWFKEYEQNKKLWILPPQKTDNRIISQQSVFVFGSPTLPTSNFRICEIKNKKAIMNELKKCGVSEETLFDDFVGFTGHNSYNKEYENWNTDSHFMSGILYYISRNYKSAIECYNKEIKSNPQSSKAYYNCGIAEQALGNLQNAVSYYDEAIRINPENCNAYNNRGCAKNDLGKAQEAISDFDEVIRINSEFSSAYNNRGIATSKLGKFQEAVSDYDEAIRIDPENCNAYNNRGLAKTNLGKFQEAISDYDKAIDLNPKDYNAYYNRGLAKTNLSKFQEAIDDYDEAIKLNSKFSKAYHNRGSTKDSLGKFQEAISDYDEVIKLNPKDYNAYYNRGIAKDNLDNFQEAISDYDEAIRLNPEHPLAYTNRGNAKNNLGKSQEAISDYDEAIRLNPKDWGAYNNRGIIKDKLGNKKDAIADFVKAKELNQELKIPDLPPDNPNK